MAVPAARYQPSPRAFPETLPPIEYAPEHHVRRVQKQGWISFKGTEFKMPKAFAGYPVAVIPTNVDGTWNVIFASQCIASINMRSAKAKTGTHVPEHM